LPMPTLLPTSSIDAMSSRQWRFKLESGREVQLAF